MKVSKIIRLAIAVPLGLALVAALIVGGLVIANTDFSDPDDIREFARGKMAKAGIPALSVAFVRDGRDFDRYCAEELFAPLDMPSTVWLHRDVDAGRLASPCDEKGRAMPAYSFPTYPDGALKTTPTEYAHFLIASMSEGRYDSFSMLRPETMREMLSPQFGDAGQALGWNYSTLRSLLVPAESGQPVAGHGGGDPGVSTLVVFNPERRNGLVVFMNKALKADPRLMNLYLLIKRLVEEAEL